MGPLKEVQVTTPSKPMGERMKITEFKDLNGSHIRVQLSGSGNIRVYIKGHDQKEDDDLTCLHLTHTQAKILCLAIEDFLESSDE